MKHKRKQISLEDVIIHIRIEEQNKTRDKSERVKESSSKANVVEERQRTKFNRPNRKTPRLSPTHQTRFKILPFKRKVIALFVASLNTMHLSVTIERNLRK